VAEVERTGLHLPRKARRHPGRQHGAAGARREEDERLAPQLPHVDGLQRGQPVGGRQRDQHRLADQRGSLEARGPLDVERGDRQVDLAARGHREHVAGGVLAQRHVDPGMGGVKRRDQAGQVQPGEGLHGAEHQPSGGQALEGGDLLARGVHLRQGAVSPQEKDVSCLGQPHPAARAFEQLDAQFLLEELDLVRERGLGHRDRSRRPGEMPVGRDGDGVTQLPEFHIDSRSKPV